MTIKVLCLTTSYPRFDGDLSGVFVFHSMRTLVQKEGARVTVLAPWEAGLPRQDQREGVRVCRFRYFLPAPLQVLAYRFEGLVPTLRKSWLARLNLPFFLLSFFIHGCRLARQCDIIHAQWIPTGFIGLLIAGLYRKPLVITARGGDMRLSEGRGWGRRFCLWLCRRADAVFSVNESFVQFLPGKISYGPNGVLLDTFKPMPRALALQALQTTPGLPAGFITPTPGTTFLAIGHWSPVKGFDVLLRAFARTLRRHPDSGARLVIIGGGEEDLPAIVREEGLAEAVLLLPFQPQSILPAWYNSCDALVIPSRQEGRPNVLLEALACLRPVLASRIPGIMEVLPAAHEPWTCIPGDADDLARLLSRALLDPSALASLAAGGRQILEQKGLTWEAHAKTLKTRYAELLLHG